MQILGQVIQYLINLITGSLIFGLGVIIQGILPYFGFQFSTMLSFVPYSPQIYWLSHNLALVWMAFVGVIFVLKSLGYIAGMRIERVAIWKFILKFIFFSFFAFASITVMFTIFNGLQSAYQSIIQDFNPTTSIDVANIWTTFKGDLQNLVNSFTGEATLPLDMGITESLNDILGGLINAVIFIIVFIDICKIVAKIVEMYIKLCIMILISPLGFVMGILDETSEIFSQYIRVFIADMFVYIMSTLLLVALFTAFGQASRTQVNAEFGFTGPTAGLQIGGWIAGADVIKTPAAGFVWSFIMVALTKVTLSLDRFVAELGVKLHTSPSSGTSFGSVLNGMRQLRRMFQGGGNKNTSRAGGPPNQTSDRTTAANPNSAASAENTPKNPTSPTSPAPVATYDANGNRILTDANGNPEKDANGNPVLVDEDGNRMMTGEDGNPVKDKNDNPVLTDADGNRMLTDDNGMPVKDENGNPILADSDGNRILTDASGDPIKDTNGNPILTDADGNQIQTDQAGRPVLDENGNPVLTDGKGNQLLTDADGKPARDGDGNAILKNYAAEASRQEKAEMDSISKAGAIEDKNLNPNASVIKPDKHNPNELTASLGGNGNIASLGTGITKYGNWTTDGKEAVYTGAANSNENARLTPDGRVLTDLGKASGGASMGPMAISGATATFADGSKLDLASQTFTDSNQIKHALTSYSDPSNKNFSLNKDSNGNVTGATLANGIGITNGGAIALSDGSNIQNGLITLGSGADQVSIDGQKASFSNGGGINMANQTFTDKDGSTHSLNGYNAESNGNFSISRNEDGAISGVNLADRSYIGADGSVRMADNSTLANGVFTTAGGTRVSGSTATFKDGSKLDLANQTFTNANQQTMPLSSYNDPSNANFSPQRDSSGRITGAVLDKGARLSSNGSIALNNGATIQNGAISFGGGAGHTAFDGQNLRFRDNSGLNMANQTFTDTAGKTHQLNGYNGDGNGFTVNRGADGQANSVTFSNGAVMGADGSTRVSDNARIQNGILSIETPHGTGGVIDTQSQTVSFADGSSVNLADKTFTGANHDTRPLSAYSGNKSFSIDKDTNGEVKGITLENGIKIDGETITSSDGAQAVIGNGYNSGRAAMMIPNKETGGFTYASADFGRQTVDFSSGGMLNMADLTYTSADGQEHSLSKYTGTGGGVFSVNRDGSGMVAGVTFSNGVTMNANGSAYLPDGTGVSGCKVTFAGTSHSQNAEISGNTISFGGNEKLDFAKHEYTDASGHVTPLSAYKGSGGGKFELLRDESGKAIGANLANDIEVSSSGKVLMGDGSSVENGTVSFRDGGSYVSSPSGGTLRGGGGSSGIVRSGERITYPGGTSVYSGGRVETKGGSILEIGSGGKGYTVTEKLPGNALASSTPASTTISGSDPSDGVELNYAANQANFLHSKTSYTPGGGASVRIGDTTAQPGMLSIQAPNGSRSTFRAIGNAESPGFEYSSASGDRVTYYAGQVPVVHPAGGGAAINVDLAGYKLPDNSIVTSSGEIMQKAGPGISRIMYIDGNQVDGYSIKTDFMNGPSKETVDLSANKYTHANKSVTGLQSGVTELRINGDYIGKYDGNEKKFQSYDPASKRGATSPASTTTLNSYYSEKTNVLAAVSKNGDGRILVNAAKDKTPQQAGAPRKAEAKGKQPLRTKK